MLSAVNANTDEQLAELSECLKKTKDCEIVATLRQFAESTNGDVHEVEVQQITTVSKNVINVNGDMVYVELSEKNGSLNDLKKIRTMWQAVLNRGTVRFLQGNANDYGITIDLICSELENSRAYVISLFNPTFMAGEDHGISLALSLDSFAFGVERVTLSEIEYEEEQRAAREAQEYTYTDMDEEYDTEDVEDEDGIGFTSRDDIISNDDLITPVKD